MISQEEAPEAALAAASAASEGEVSAVAVPVGVGNLFSKISNHFFLN